ncbi:MAG: DUF2341 domain-containing protein, partial [Proteobacteria bacterium]|nr:DUF2341 domain-containing protein [Pseudomonadota bacterium]
MTATNANGTSLTSLSSNSVTPLSVFSRNITFASTPTANFQVRVVLNTSNFSYTKANSSGNDLRFASSSSSTSYYDYWIESWNYNGTSVLWVEIPSAGTTSCVMTYGDS